MSGIVGIYRPDAGAASHIDLDRMAQAIAHRGPDDRGVWCSGPAGLGHLMLWTTRESLQEKLPLVSDEGDLVLTGDARIDNRGDLLAQVGLSTAPNGEVADSSLILAAYRKWGECCVEHLVGDFAFAIWDDRRQTLFCARDQFGVKPFYYHSSPRLFAFASEIKALLTLGEVPRRIDEVKVAHYLTSSFDDTANTFYEGIWRLPPAHTLTVSRRGARLRRYWSLDPSQELQLAGDDEYAERFREVFALAVSSRVRSAYPVGTLLSGGLDSSSITCVARDLIAERGCGPLSTFSAVFDEVPQCDERPFIEAVVAQGGVDPHFVHGDQLSPLAHPDGAPTHADGPASAFNLFLSRALYSAAKGRGVKVLLDGFDGDTTVSHGIGYLAELARGNRWFSLAREARGIARTNDLPVWGLMWRYVWRYGVWPLLRRPARIKRSMSRLTQRQSGRAANGRARGFALNPEFARRVGLTERLETHRRARPSTERADHLQNLTSGVMPYTLELLDEAAAAIPVEPRYPFWDKRLVELCLALPATQKIHQGWTRLVIRRAMEGVLPSEIQWRPGKSDLGPNFNHTLLTRARKQLEDVILSDGVDIERYMDIGALRQCYARFVSRESDDPRPIWRAVTLALWLQQAKVTSQAA